MERKWRVGSPMSHREWCHIDEIPTHWFMATLPWKWPPVLLCGCVSLPHPLPAFREAVLGSSVVYAAGIEFIEHRERFFWWLTAYNIVMILILSLVFPCPPEIKYPNWFWFFLEILFHPTSGDHLIRVGQVDMVSHYSFLFFKFESGSHFVLNYITCLNQNILLAQIPQRTAVIHNPLCQPADFTFITYIFQFFWYDVNGRNNVSEFKKHLVAMRRRQGE